MKILYREKLFGYLKKCNFVTKEAIFLCYVATGDGIKLDDSKIEAIHTWPIPKSIRDMRSFHGLPSFFRRFIKDLTAVMAPMTEVVKSSSFKWSSKAQAVFEEVKG